MANNTKLVAGVAWTSYLTTGLNSLGNGSSVLGAAIDNTSNLNLLLDISVILGSINPSGTPYLELRIEELLGDGSTYSDDVGSNWSGRIELTTGSSAKNGHCVGIPLTLGQFKVRVYNRSGVSLASSGNTLYYRTYSLQNNA